MAAGGKLRISQIGASDTLHDFTCVPCFDDGKNTEALFQCTDCQIFYCQRCVTGHNKFTKNHNVIDKASRLFGQGQRQPKLPSSGQLPTDLCEEHHGQVIQMFCGQHDTVCCTICIAVKHRSCEGVEYIPNIAKGLLNRQDKNKNKTSLEKVKEDLEILKSKMQEELEELSNQRDGILDEIQKFKKRLIKRVEELEKMSIKEVQEKHKAIADNLDACTRKIGDILDGVDKRLYKLKDSKGDNEAQTFVDIKFAEKQVADGNDYIKRSCVRNVEVLKFEGSQNIASCLSEVQSLGALNVTRTVATIADKSNIEKAITLFLYEAENEDELTIQVGDMINVLDKELEDSGWWKGEQNGKIGVFPENFVRLVKEI